MSWRRVVCFAFLFSTWSMAQDATAADKKITYDDHVLPILKDKCLSCHNQDKKRSGLNVSTYIDIMQGGSSGASVKPGDAEGSFLYRVMTHAEEPYMPPRQPKLPDASLNVIRDWIDGGALENSGSKAMIVKKPSVDIGLSSVVRGKPEGPPPMPPITVQGNPVVHTDQTTAVTAMASNPWSPLLAISGQKQVLLYNADTSELLGVLPFPEGEVHVLKFSRNGSLLLAAGGVGGKSGRVVLWSVRTGQRVVEVGEETDCVLAADISPDQTRIALGGPSKVVRIFSTKDGGMLHEVRKHTDWITALEYSPDGVLLATGDRNGGLFVWEAYTAREFYTLRGHSGMITDISWRTDSNVVASSSEDATVRLWEMQNGRQIKSWGAHGGGTLSVEYVKNGNVVSAGRDSTVKMWDGNGKALRTFPKMADLALQTTPTHDSTKVVGGDWTGKLLVWNAADGKQVAALDPNPMSIVDQLQAAVTQLIAAVAKRDQLAATVKVSQANAAKANAELTAAQKAVTDTANLVKTAMAAAAAAKTKLDAANAAANLAQANTAAKQVLVTALNEAAAKVKAQADKTPTDKALAAASAKAAELAKQAAAEVTTAQQAAAGPAAAAKAATDAYAAAQKAVTDAQAKAAAAPKTLAAKQAAVAPILKKATDDQAALTKAKADVQAISTKIDQLKATLVGTPPAPPKK